MAKKRPNWFLPGWVHKQAHKHSLLEQVRARDGDSCWLCNHPMRFGGIPNCGKAATIEHLLPKSKGGTNALDNLRLCHIGCNRHLADYLPEQKERMRLRN